MLEIIDGAATNARYNLQPDPIQNNRISGE
jgi:hypothetical protein